MTVFVVINPIKSQKIRGNGTQLKLNFNVANCEGRTFEITNTFSAHTVCLISFHLLFIRAPCPRLSQIQIPGMIDLVPYLFWTVLQAISMTREHLPLSSFLFPFFRRLHSALVVLDWTAAIFAPRNIIIIPS